MEYDDLLAGAKLNPQDADFTQLRLVYTRSPQYDPYVLDTMDEYETTRTSMYEAIGEGHTESALEAINRLLETKYLDTEAHLHAAFVYERLGDEAKSTYHRQFADGLVRSIFQSGDGRGYETAFVVIDVAEEYATLNALGIEPGTQCLKEYAGHQFDVFEFRHPDTGGTIEVYFNIDLPRGWLNRTLKDAGTI